VASQSLFINKGKVTYIWGEQIPTRFNKFMLVDNENINETSSVILEIEYAEKDYETLYRNAIEASEYLSHDLSKEELEFRIKHAINESLLSHAGLVHVMGGTNMGLGSGDSVVDSYGKIHDIDGLYISGNSNLPSGSCFGPTLLSACLSIRQVESILMNLD